MKPAMPPPAAHPLDTLTDTPPPPAEGLSLQTVPFTRMGDFLEFYGLEENPFADCIHPSYFFRTERHGSALRDMMLAVEFKTALGLVTGPSGSGKTLVSQILLRYLDEQNQPVILVPITPGLTMSSLLREILSELEIALPGGILRVQDLMKLLSNYIIELTEEGHRLVILIDECHFLSADCLHILRTISNLETPEGKLVTCLLFGESRFLQRLQHPSYESLLNRMFLRCQLTHLTPEETEQYIKFRLLTAGRLTDLFTNEACRLIHEKTGGICRRISKLATLCLISSASRQQPLIDEAIVRESADRM